MTGKMVIVNDRMQKGCRYFLTEPEGGNFHADFKPELSRSRCSILVFSGGSI